MPSDDKVREELGMSKNQAAHRLRKILLFDFACRLGLDKCLRCGGQLTLDDFTIDHKESWLLCQLSYRCKYKSMIEFPMVIRTQT